MRPWLLTCYAGIVVFTFGTGFCYSTFQVLGWTPLSAMLTLGSAAAVLLLLGVLAGVR